MPVQGWGETSPTVGPTLNLPVLSRELWEYNSFIISIRTIMCYHVPYKPQASEPKEKGLRPGGPHADFYCFQGLVRELQGRVIDLHDLTSSP